MIANSQGPIPIPSRHRRPAGTRPRLPARRLSSRAIEAMRWTCPLHKSKADRGSSITLEGSPASVDRSHPIRISSRLIGIHQANLLASSAFNAVGPNCAATNAMQANADSKAHRSLPRSKSLSRYARLHCRPPTIEGFLWRWSSTRQQIAGRAEVPEPQAGGWVIKQFWKIQRA